MYQNAILASLPTDQSDKLRPYMVKQHLTAHQILRQEGDPRPDVYFVESGLISLLTGPRQVVAETALIGREGMVGCQALLGATTAPSSAVVQVGGTAWRIAAPEFLEAAEADTNLQRRVLTYVHERMKGEARAIISASRCTITQRVAGWLLMARDRLESDDIAITHDSLAAALGVRRPGVTVATHILEGEHALISRRGKITVRSQELLQRRAGPAYRPLPQERPNATDLRTMTEIGRSQSGLVGRREEAINPSLASASASLSPA